MKDVWIDETKETSLKELVKPEISYNDSVSVDIQYSYDRFDLVRITRIYTERVTTKTDSFTVHKRMAVILKAEVNVHNGLNQRQKPTNIWISDAKSFLYMLRTVKDNQHLNLSLWLSNDCDMYKEKGIGQETVIMSVHNEKHKEIFAITINQIFDKIKFGDLEHMFRYKYKIDPITIEVKAEV